MNCGKRIKALFRLVFWITLIPIAEGEELFLESRDGNYRLIPGVALQFQHRTEIKENNADTSGFLLRRGRLKLKGHLIAPELEYEVEFDVGTPDPGDPRFDLKDFYLDYRREKFLRITAGQFKIPFGFQELTSSKKQQFVERSSASEEFALGRDLGLMLAGSDEMQSLEYYIGIFNSEGGNNLSADVENLYARQVVMNPLGKYKEGESNLQRTAMYQLTAGLENFYTRETVSGDHLLTGGSFIGYKHSGFPLRAEYFYRDNRDDSAVTGKGDARGYYAQAGFFLVPRKVEIALRQSRIIRLNGNNDAEEQAAVLNYFFQGHHAKLQLEYTRQVIEGIHKH